jgi:hypothetical protein
MKTSTYIYIYIYICFHICFRMFVWDLCLIMPTESQLMWSHGVPIRHLKEFVLTTVILAPGACSSQDPPDQA